MRSTRRDLLGTRLDHAELSGRVWRVAKSSSSSKKNVPTTSELALARVPEGVSVREMFRVARRMGIAPERFEEISGASVSRLRRGRGGEEPISPEALIVFRRCAQVFQRAVALCGGNEDAAEKWVAAEAPALKGRKPIEAAETAPGLAAVEKLIAQIESAIA